jgi:hypothetical protein
MWAETEDVTTTQLFTHYMQLDTQLEDIQRQLIDPSLDPHKRYELLQRQEALQDERQRYHQPDHALYGSPWLMHYACLQHDRQRYLHQARMALWYQQQGDMRVDSEQVIEQSREALQQIEERMAQIPSLMQQTRGIHTMSPDIQNRLTQQIYTIHEMDQVIAYEEIIHQQGGTLSPWYDDLVAERRAHMDAYIADYADQVLMVEPPPLVPTAPPPIRRHIPALTLKTRRDDVHVPVMTVVSQQTQANVWSQGSRWLRKAQRKIMKVGTRLLTAQLERLSTNQLMVMAGQMGLVWAGTTLSLPMIAAAILSHALLHTTVQMSVLWAIKGDTMDRTQIIGVLTGDVVRQITQDVLSATGLQVLGTFFVGEVVGLVAEGMLIHWLGPSTHESWIPRRLSEKNRLQQFMTALDTPEPEEQALDTAMEEQWGAMYPVMGLLADQVITALIQGGVSVVPGQVSTANLMQEISYAWQRFLGEQAIKAVKYGTTYAVEHTPLSRMQLAYFQALTQRYQMKIQRGWVSRAEAGELLSWYQTHTDFMKNQDQDMVEWHQTMMDLQRLIQEGRFQESNHSVEEEQVMTDVWQDRMQGLLLEFMPSLLQRVTNRMLLHMVDPRRQAMEPPPPETVDTLDDPLVETLQPQMGPAPWNPDLEQTAKRQAFEDRLKTLEKQQPQSVPHPWMKDMLRAAAQAKADGMQDVDAWKKADRETWRQKQKDDAATKALEQAKQEELLRAAAQAKTDAMQEWDTWKKADRETWRQKQKDDVATKALEQAKQEELLRAAAQARADGMQDVDAWKKADRETWKQKQKDDAATKALEQAKQEELLRAAAQAKTDAMHEWDTWQRAGRPTRKQKQKDALTIDAATKALEQAKQDELLRAAAQAKVDGMQEWDTWQKAGRETWKQKQRDDAAKDVATAPITTTTLVDPLTTTENTVVDPAIIPTSTTNTVMTAADVHDLAERYHMSPEMFRMMLVNAEPILDPTSTKVWDTTTQQTLDQVLETLTDAQQELLRRVKEHEFDRMEAVMPRIYKQVEMVMIEAAVNVAMTTLTAGLDLAHVPAPVTNALLTYKPLLTQYLTYRIRAQLYGTKLPETDAADIEQRWHDANTQLLVTFGVKNVMRALGDVVGDLSITGATGGSALALKIGERVLSSVSQMGGTAYRAIHKVKQQIRSDFQSIQEILPGIRGEVIQDMVDSFVTQQGGWIGMMTHQVIDLRGVDAAHDRARDNMSLEEMQARLGSLAFQEAEVPDMLSLPTNDWYKQNEIYVMEQALSFAFQSAHMLTHRDVDLRTELTRPHMERLMWGQSGLAGWENLNAMYQMARTTGEVLTQVGDAVVPNALKTRETRRKHNQQKQEAEAKAHWEDQREIEAAERTRAEYVSLTAEADQWKNAPISLETLAQLQRIRTRMSAMEGNVGMSLLRLVDRINKPATPDHMLLVTPPDILEQVKREHPFQYPLPRNNHVPTRHKPRQQQALPDFLRL